jgi:dienelactone hydrolase
MSILKVTFFSNGIMFKKNISRPFALVLLCLLMIFWYFSPILKLLPHPSGPYAIGIQTLPLIDQRRSEQFAPRAKRAVMAHIWYPAQIQEGTQYPYLGNLMPLFKKTFAQMYGIPNWLSNFLWRNIYTHAYADLPVAQKQTSYPVILFSHGLLGLSTQMYASIIENLASHGYIVVGIDHPYFNILTQLPDGSIASSLALNAQFQKMNQTEQNIFLSKAIDVYKADFAFVLDELKKLNQNKNSIFYTKFDLERIGVMGHSAGGTASIEFCRMDERCKAAVDLDGWYDHVIGQEPIEKPLLLLFGQKSIEVAEPSAEYLQRKELTRDQYFEREANIAKHKKALCSEQQCSMIIIPEATHDDFGDGVLLKWPLRPWHAADSYKMLEQINERLVEFFVTYL